MIVSVCVATYNGLKHLDEQLSSILQDLRADDELIVVDDGSTDGTFALLAAYIDPRIKVYKNVKNIGHIKTFSRLLELATGEIIVMSDQDDIWIKGRLDSIRKALSESDAWLVTGRQKFFYSNKQSDTISEIGLKSKDSTKNILNISRIILGTSKYYGCLMGMKRELVKEVLPIPSYIESHDLWIAICANLNRRNKHIEDYLLYRRIHGGNISLTKRPLHKKILSRLINLFALINIAVRAIKQKRSLK